jgi:type I restriction enzyme S subunit
MAETLFRQWFVVEAKEEWEVKPLGEILNITSSKRIFYSEYVSSGIPFYRSKEIIELSKIGYTNSDLFIPETRYQEISAKHGAPVAGDILMTSVGTIGVTYRVRPGDCFYFKDGNLTWFKDFKLLPSSIVYLWLNSQLGKEAVENVKIGSTQEALTIEGLKSIEMVIPPKIVLDKITNKFETILEKQEKNKAQVYQLMKIRDTLLPKLMSGQVRVKTD